jgi:hypothetical protein
MKKLLSELERLRYRIAIAHAQSAPNNLEFVKLRTIVAIADCKMINNTPFSWKVGEKPPGKQLASEDANRDSITKFLRGKGILSSKAIAAVAKKLNTPTSWLLKGEPIPGRMEALREEARLTHVDWIAGRPIDPIWIELGMQLDMHLDEQVSVSFNASRSELLQLLGADKSTGVSLSTIPVMKKIMKAVGDSMSRSLFDGPKLAPGRTRKKALKRRS